MSIEERLAALEEHVEQMQRELDCCAAQDELEEVRDNSCYEDFHLWEAIADVRAGRTVRYPVGGCAE